MNVCQFNQWIFLITFFAPEVKVIEMDTILSTAAKRDLQSYPNDN